MFAFTVRKDWFPKLKSDSSRISKTQSGISRLVYECTSHLTAGEKDKACRHILATYGWRLDPFT